MPASERLKKALSGAAAAGLAAACLPSGSAPIAAAAAAEAVTTPGSGTLTKCRGWLVYTSCTTYGKIALPARIAVGDRIDLVYGSNPKDYRFHVVGIRRHGDRCTILSDHSGAGVDGEKIEVAPCRSVAEPAAAR